MTTAMIWGLLALFVGFVVLAMLIARLRRQVSGGWGPTELSDGSMTTTPTGYPEEMRGGGRKIGPTENAAGKL